MGNKSILVSGGASFDSQFTVVSDAFSYSVSSNVSNAGGEVLNPLEFLLAGFAGSINAVGLLVAKELDLDLKSIQIEISGEFESKKYEGVPTRSRSGFRKIEVLVKPISEAPLDLLKKWIDIVKERCPLRDNLVNETPVIVTLLKEYTRHDAA